MTTDSTARPEEHAPINWLTTTVFTLTPFAALTLVPWYGFAHGFSLWAWVSFVFFLWACGISITAGYHRLWSHRAYQALVRAPVLRAVRRDGDAAQHPGVGLAAPHPPPLRGRRGQGPRLFGEASGVREVLAPMLDLGLGYLALSQPAPTLSGGEAQRIRLATQVGSHLMGVLYVLDEPRSGCTRAITTACCAL